MSSPRPDEIVGTHATTDEKFGPTTDLGAEDGTLGEHVHNMKEDQVNFAANAAEDAEQNIPLGEAFKRYKKAVFWAAFMSLTLVMEGYDKSLLGNFWALPAFSKRFGVQIPGTEKWTVEAKFQALTNNAALIGAFFGSIAAGSLVDRFGYRKTVVSNLLFLIPWIGLVTYAPNITALIFGELLCGLPWGVFAVLGPSYASEVCPISLRGYLTTYVNLCWVMGQFISSGVVLGIQGMEGVWAYRIPMSLQWFWPLVLTPILFFAPESPWWLVRHEKLEEAEQSIKRLSSNMSTQSIEETLAMMIRTNEVELQHSDMQKGSRWIECFRGVDLRRTEVSAMAWATQVLSGDGFAGNVTYFFNQAGLSTSDSYKMGLGNTAGAFVGTVGSWFLLARFGRRPIFIFGLLWMAMLWMVIGGLDVAATKGNNGGAKWGEAGLFLLFVLSYDFTIGPIVYCIVGETSSVRLRQKTIALSRNTFYILNVVSGVISPYMLNPLQWAWRGKAGFFWAVPALASAVWGYYRLPEMKDRSYYELDVLFERRVPARQFAKTEVKADQPGPSAAAAVATI